MNFTFSNHAAELRFSTRIYDLEAVMNACYNWVERYYFYFDECGRDRIRVSIKPKGKSKKNEIRKMVGELHNQVLSELLRLKVSVRNKGIREKIVEQAISSALSLPKMPAQLQDARTTEELAKLNKELDKILERTDKMSYEDDPLQIATPLQRTEISTSSTRKNTKKKARLKKGSLSRRNKKRD